jgi:voltage-gated potassium channel
VTTVGYGDEVPMTVGGRITGMVLMFSGIGLFLYLAGRIASHLLEREESDVAQITQHFDNELDKLRKEFMQRLDELSEHR